MTTPTHGVREALDMCVNVLKHVQKTYSVPDSPIINMALERAAKALAAQSPVLPPSGVIDLLERLRDYLDINHQPGSDLGPKFSAEITAALSASVAVGQLQCLRCGTVDAFGPISKEKM